MAPFKVVPSLDFPGKWSLYMRNPARDLDRNDLIAAVTIAWNAIPARDKPALMLAHPELYAAVARLAALETVATERKRA